jgi:hypothetical protein
VDVAPTIILQDPLEFKKQLNMRLWNMLQRCNRADEVDRLVGSGIDTPS